MSTLCYGRGVYSAAPSVEEIGCKSSKVTEKFRTRREKTDDFVTGKDFQNFCNCPENGIQPGIILQITIGLYNDYYPLGGDRGVDDFRFNIAPRDGIRFFKSNGVCKPKYSCEKRIYFGESYYVTRDAKGKWKPVLLLKDEHHLLKVKVKQAFETICRMRNYTLGQIFLAEVSYPEQPVLAAWVAEADGPDGEKRRLLCMLENGRIVDESASELEVSKLSKHYIATRFCAFKYDAQGILQRVR